MIEDTNTELDIFEDDFGLLVAEGRIRDIDDELEELYYRSGSHFIWQLKVITSHPSFYPIKGEDNIYTTGGESGEDYENLLNAARKAVEHGYRVFILPNMFDLKTVSGNNSVDNRLSESVGQTNRVLLNMAVDYNPSALARSIKHYFESNQNAYEVLIFKGKKQLSITRKSLEDTNFFRTFIRRFIK